MQRIRQQVSSLHTFREAWGAFGHRKPPFMTASKFSQCPLHNETMRVSEAPSI
jgi:hypothetical protein